MLKGTRVLFGDEAYSYRQMTENFRKLLLKKGYLEVIVPSIWGAKTFQDKIAGETLQQMWTFKDKGDRDCCLIPEVTGIIQEMFNEDWDKRISKPIKLFYESKCYRYEKPQAGRYREFTQFGLEILGPVSEAVETECKQLLKDCIEIYTTDYLFVSSVQRGLGYYTSNGFEVEIPSLGSQKQVAGGGKYKEGIGWAIGIDRLLMVAGV